MTNKQTVATIAGFLAALAVIAGFLLANIPYSYEACAGEVVSTNLCEPARLGRTIVGAALIAGGLISLGLVAAGAVIAKAIGRNYK